MPESNNKKGFFENISTTITKATGTTAAFIIAVLLILLWAVTGPIFNFSNTWQLVINTTTTIITFLMVFIIQRSQNKESLSIQLKLNELLAAVKGASVEMINIEQLSESDLNELLTKYTELVNKLQNRHNSKLSISVTDIDVDVDKKISDNDMEIKDLRDDIDDLHQKRKNN